MAAHRFAPAASPRLQIPFNTLGRGKLTPQDYLSCYLLLQGLWTLLEFFSSRALEPSFQIPGVPGVLPSRVLNDFVPDLNAPWRIGFRPFVDLGPFPESRLKNRALTGSSQPFQP